MWLTSRLQACDMTCWYLTTPNVNQKLALLGLILIKSIFVMNCQNIPKSFARANGIESRSGEIIVLMNEKGTSWTLILKRKNSCGTMYITRGWRRFCRANGLKAGCFFTFKLIQRGGTLFLHKSPSSTESEDSSEGDEIEPLSTESKSFKKTSSIWKASSSSFQNLFVTLTLKPYEVEKSTLVSFIDMQFVGLNSI